MQKIRNRGSILLWAVFLSLTISISFMSISSQINKNIKNNYKQIDSYNSQNIIKNKLKNKDYTNENFIDTNESITFMQNKTYIGNLKNLEELKLDFPETSNINIEILEGGPILANSELIETNSGFTISPGKLNIKNLAGYTKFKINSDKNLISPEYIYKIEKTIGNKQVVKTRGIIKNN